MHAGLPTPGSEDKAYLASTQASQTASLVRMRRKDSVTGAPDNTRASTLKVAPSGSSSCQGPAERTRSYT